MDMLNMHPPHTVYLIPMQMFESIFSNGVAAGSAASLASGLRPHTLMQTTDLSFITHRQTRCKQPNAGSLYWFRFAHLGSDCCVWYGLILAPWCLLWFYTLQLDVLSELMLHVIDAEGCKQVFRFALCTQVIVFQFKYLQNAK